MLQISLQESSFHRCKHWWFVQIWKWGGGLYIQHGFATIIAAEQVGENFWVNQQVTIGYKNGKAPIIKDNVSVFAGAIIIGGVTINSYSKVGAGAIVTNNIPENATVISPKARIYGNTLIEGIET